MQKWLVTVKLELPRTTGEKVIGGCPFTGRECSDIEGRHHTTIIEAPSAVEAAQAAPLGVHITRVEGPF